MLFRSVENLEIAAAPIAVAHRNPELVATLRTLRTVVRVPAEQPHSLAAARVSREPQIVTEVSPEMYQQYGLAPAELEMLRTLAPRSYVGLPMLARGILVGTLMLVISESDRRFQPSDLEHLTNIAARAGLALENARLYDHQRWVEIGRAHV